MPDPKIGFKISIDPASKRMVMSDIGDIQSAMSEMLTDFLKSGDSSLKTMSEVLKTLKETRKEGGDVAAGISDVVAEFGKTSDQIKPILVYLEEMRAKGIKIDEVIGHMGEQFRGVSKAAKESSDALENIMKALGGFSGLGIDKVLKDAYSGMKDLGGGVLELLNPATFGKGLGDIFGGIEKLRASSEALRLAWSDLNRSAIDINATLGETGGVLSHDLLSIAGKLGAEFVMMPDKVMAIEKGLANAGVHSKDLEKTSRDILTEFTSWTELTPEKQIAMMGDLMAKFGMSTEQAKNSMFAIFSQSKGIVEQLNLSNVSAKSFMDASLSLEQNARQIGYSFGDATQMLSAMVGLLKDAKGNVDMTSVTQMTQGMMGIGTTNIGMQAFMMGHAGVKGTALEQAGAFIGTESDKDKDVRRIGAQVDTLSTFLKATGGGAMPKTEAGMLGGIELINKELGLGMDLASQRRMAGTLFETGKGKTPEENWNLLREAMVKQAQEAEKEKETNEKAKSELAKSGATTETILHDTKTIEQRMAADIAGILAHTGDMAMALMHPEQMRSEADARLKKSKQENEIRSLRDAYFGTNDKDKRSAIAEKAGYAGVDIGSDFSPQDLEIARMTPKMDVSRLSKAQRQHQERLQWFITAIPAGHAQNDAPGRSGSN